jgi:hypothetical protein
MRSLTLVLLLLSLAVVAGCATKIDPNHQLTVKLYDAEREAREARFANLTATAEGCQEDACRTTIAAFAALAQAAGGGAPPAPVYRKQYHPAWGILGAVAPAAISAAVSWHQSDNTRDVSIAQYGFLGGVIRDVAQSPALQTPSIIVGGDYVPGSQHIGDAVGGDYITGHVGDAVGRDQIGRDQHIGDEIGRDAIGRDRIDNAGNIGNDNRIDSPGPFDIDTGDRCTGDQCQGESPPPDPEPEPEPEPDDGE